MLETPYNFEPFVPQSKHFINLTGQQFGLWKVISIYGRSKRGAAIWLCLCKCGTWRAVPVGSLRNGHSQSCGCDESRWRNNRGQGRTVEYKTYHSARRRCLNPSDSAYPDYGGRGIEFRFTSFAEFFNELGPRPEDKTSVDRIDVNGHYELGNVRWANDFEQANNKRPNRGWQKRKAGPRLRQSPEHIANRVASLKLNKKGFPSDPADFFEMADALVADTPLGEEIDFDGIILE